MKIKNWLKDKYWLWGVIFGLGLEFLLWGPITYLSVYLRKPTFSWDQFFFLPSFYPFLNKFFLGIIIFCGISFEIIFRSFNWYKKSSPNTIPRLIFLSIFTASTILFSGIITIGFIFFALITLIGD